MLENKIHSIEELQEKIRSTFLMIPEEYHKLDIYKLEPNMENDKENMPTYKHYQDLSHAEQKDGLCFGHSDTNPKTGYLNNAHLDNYHSILNEVIGIHDKKNHDYAGDEDSLFNLRMSETMGIPPFKGTCVRLSDKFCRLMMYCKSGELAVNDEGIEDTLKDIINYSVFAIEFHREEMAKAKQESKSEENADRVQSE